MSKLPYLEACLRETLRLHPTSPGFSMTAKDDQVLNGQYTIKDKEVVKILLAQLHRDPEVYGSDVEEFRPSRMLDEAFAKLPPNTWKVSSHSPLIDVPRAIWLTDLILYSLLETAFALVLAGPLPGRNPCLR